MKHSGRTAGGWEPVSCVTADGVRLVGVHQSFDAAGSVGRQPADAAAPGAAPLFLVWHGMTNRIARPWTFAVLAGLARHGEVLAFDFRGHGRSGGRSTVGDLEVADVEAGLTAARRLAAGSTQGARRAVVLVGFSMGAAVVLRHQGMVARGAPAVVDAAERSTLAERADAVVSVSAPARWFLRESSFMRRVQWLLEHPAGTLVGSRVGIRLGTPWPQVPTTPLEEVSAFAGPGVADPVPLLLVHGTADHYFGVDQALALHRAAPRAELRIIEGMTHAESGIDQATLDGVAEWARLVTATQLSGA